MSKQADGGTERYHKRQDREKAHDKMLPGEDDQPLPEPVKPISSDGKPKRNEPCPCGSGKKFKQCCGKA